MKRIITAVAVALIFAAGSFVYAHGPGYEGKGCGQMMGPGHGDHMMGKGHGRHMMDRDGAISEDKQKFLDETKELRRDLHNKRFEYMEMSRSSDSSDDSLIMLEKEIFNLEDRIREKAPRNPMGKAGNYGHCW